MLQTADFWAGLFAIIWIDIILSGDNAVVIALAARSLPPDQQRKAVFFGAGAAILLRVVLTIFAAFLIQLPWLKLVGGLLLFWIAIKLLLPDEEQAEVAGYSNLLAAIRTIVMADLVMSVDNVLAVAGASGGNDVLLVLGLLISIPLMIVGATLLMGLMERYPAIILLGAAIIGGVAAEMVSTDPFVAQWLEQHAPWLHAAYVLPVINLHILQVLGAFSVVILGTWLARRRNTSN
ncbi:Predicted integral membrane protein, TerC family [gamma proteobacterium HdN1]|nr:Predicted integral membrane protein, TerC family [gamma proteobacterium HdN1]